MSKFINTVPVDALLQRSFYVPSNLMASNLLSKTSSAIICFTEQKFSSDLQAFLVNYNISVESYYAVYK